MLLDRACEGWVVHRRLGPVPHEFRYPVWMLHVDVDHLEAGQTPLATTPWLSLQRRLAPLSLRQRDYPRGTAVSGDIRSRIGALLHSHGHPAADRVFLLTQPRSWGWLFNPVSFYFCFCQERLTSIVAEITNTPWDEVHHYVLDARRTERGECTFSFAKQFHVSPFMPMDLDYHWRFKLTDDQVQIAMRLTRGGEEQFFAGLYLQCVPLGAAALRRGALRYPWQNVRTLARIYWQAALLWWKGAPFHPHPASLKEVRST